MADTTGQAIRDFIQSIGVARADSLVDSAMLDHAIRDALNRTALRRMAVLRPLKVVVENYPEVETEELDALNNPEDPAAGSRRVLFGREIFVERDDFPHFPGAKFRVTTMVSDCTAGENLLVVVWADMREKHSRIYFRRSLDNGTTWEGPESGQALLPDVAFGVAHCCLPQAAATKSGAIGCTFYTYGPEKGQQLIKVLYMNGDDDGWRKPEDLLLALKLEARYDKHTILENYFNAVYYGHGAYGIGQASQVYFHRPPAQLDLARASMLAGLPQSPSYYDLYRNPCSARARQFNVLAQMAHDGYISANQAAAAYAESIGFPCQ